VWNHLFPHSVLEDRGKKALLGLVLKAHKTKKEEASHLAILSGQELVQMC
jgi:hypothetical protein